MPEPAAVGPRERPGARLQCKCLPINRNTEKPQTSKQAGMWLELFRSIQPGFTAGAQELGMKNLPTCRPWIVGAAGQTSSEAGPLPRAARCSPAALSGRVSPRRRKAAEK